MVNVSSGGRKKKLNANIAAAEATNASTNPQPVAMPSTHSR